MDTDLFGANTLLAAVEPAARVQFARHLRPIHLDRGQLLYSQGNRLDQVYFPTDGLVAILAETADGEMIDSAIIGREGAVGVFEACGSRQFFAEALVQVPGKAARMSASAYRELFEASPGIRTAVHRYVEQLMSETRQSVVCNSLHEVEGRLCRNMLEAMDKARLGTSLPFTQSMLARMLGAQRTTVAETISRLQRDGVLKSRRGSIEISDRDALERLSCSCRSAIQMTRKAIWSAEEPACEAVIAAE